MSSARPVEEVLEMCRRVGTFTSDPISIDDRDLLGDTPLHVASQMGDAIAVETLVNAGANANAMGDRGRTPLFCTESAKVAKILVAAGANLDHRDNDGMTVVELAEILNRQEILALFS
jgi:ankyrin repeat protein